MEQSLTITEPEWTLHRETETGRSECWTVRTGDIALIQSLIINESEQDREPRTAGNGQSRTTQMETLSLSALAVRKDSAAPLPTVPPGRPAFEPASSASVVLSGELREVDLCSVVQSINLCKMTGKLIVYNDVEQAELFFTEGDLVHALASNALQSSSVKPFGESVVLELFTWDEGTFRFQHGWKSEERSIKKRLHSLLLEGAALRDYQDALTDKSLTQASLLSHSDAGACITETEFESRLRKAGLPVHIALQKRVFVALRTAATVEKLLQAIPMPRSIWVPIIFNLTNLGLVTISGAASQEAEEVNLFWDADALIASAQKTLLQPDSGMYAYPYFLLQLSNEFVRCNQGGPPFCVAMIELPNDPAALSLVSMQQLSETFWKLKRPFDILSFSMPNYLFALIPQVDGMLATKLFHRYIQDVVNMAHQASPQSSTYQLKCGIACAPKDGVDLAQLLNCANRNRHRAGPGFPIVTSVG